MKRRKRKAKASTKKVAPRRPSGRARQPVARNTKTVASLERALAEALEHQAATSEVLRVIANTPGELKPVFDAILANALRICEAEFGNLLLLDGNGVRLVAHRNAPKAYLEIYAKGPIIPGRHTAVGRAIRTKKIIHVSDVRAGAAFKERDPLRMATAIHGPGMLSLNCKASGPKTLLVPCAI